MQLVLMRQLLNGFSVALMEIILFFDYKYVYMHSFSSIKLWILKNTVYINHKLVHYINVYEEKCEKNHCEHDPVLLT